MDNVTQQDDSQQYVVITIAGNGVYGYRDGNNTTSQFYYPNGISIDKHGNIIVADTFNHRIRKIDVNGNVTTIAGSGTCGYYDNCNNLSQFNYPNGLSIDKLGNIIVADSGNHRIRKIDVNGNVTTIAGDGKRHFKNGTRFTSSFNRPEGVVTDSKGNIIVADSGNHRIRKIDVYGNVTTIAGNGVYGYFDGSNTSSQFYYPNSVSIDKHGNIIVADTDNHKIRRIDVNGNVTTVGNNGYIDVSPQFNYPRGISIDNNDNIIVADSCNNRMCKIDSNGKVTTIAGNGVEGYLDGNHLSSQFNLPVGVAIDNDGNIIVADYHSHRIRMILSATPMCPFLNPEQLSHMESLSNTLDLACNVACDNQFHHLYTKQTLFHLHKAILSVRAPGLLNLNELDIEPTLFKDIVHFIYTNIPLNFKNMKITQIIHLIPKCKLIHLMDLIPLCQQALITSLTKDNVFNTAAECYSLNLTDELDWIAWFIGKNNVSPPKDVKLPPTLLSKLISQVANLTLQPPKISPKLRPLGEVMEILFLQKLHTDFTIIFKNKLIKVHKFVLALRWPYFTNIMLKNESSTLHDSPMPSDTFGKLIQYFYVGAKYLTLRDCGWILYLSEYYLLHDEKSLLKYCDQMVNSQIYMNWASVLQFAIEIDNNEIEQKAILMIPASIKPQQIVSLYLGFIKEQQRSIQEQKRTFQQQRVILNNIETHLSKVESHFTLKNT